MVLSQINQYSLVRLIQSTILLSFKRWKFLIQLDWKSPTQRDFFHLYFVFRQTQSSFFFKLNCIAPVQLRKTFLKLLLITRDFNYLCNLVLWYFYLLGKPSEIYVTELTNNKFSFSFPAVFILIAIAVFVAKMNDDNVTAFDYHFAFAFCIIAMMTAIAAGCIMVVNVLK